MRGRVVKSNLVLGAVPAGEGGVQAELCRPLPGAYARKARQPGARVVFVLALGPKFM